MHVLTIVTVVWTLPIETVQILLDCFDEVLTSDDSISWGFTDFDTRIRINIDVRLLRLLDSHVVRVLALFAFFTDTCLEIWTQSIGIIDLSCVSGLNLSDLLKQILQKIGLCLLLGLLCFLLTILLFNSARTSLKKARQK